MIVTLIYFVVFCFIIYRTSFFGVFNDEQVSKRTLLLAFIFKCLGIIVFYFVYAKFYGGIQTFDTQHFYHDSKVLRDISRWDTGEFLKVMFGFYDESSTGKLFSEHLSKTNIWDKDPSEVFYNDNRLVIRLHALIHFISFGRYGVHALFSCFIGFIGIVWIYKSFKFVFVGKERALFWLWILFPGLWFWSSTVLKEAPALFVMGLLFLSLKKLFIDKRVDAMNVFSLLLSAVLCFILKHYLMLPLLALSSLFFAVYSFRSLKMKTLAYCAGILLLLFGGNAVFKMLFGKTAVSILASRQHTFKDVSKGGIFLLDSVKFVRLPYEYSLVDIDSSSKPIQAKIKKEVAFIYWEHSHQSDTLYCNSNRDSLTNYELKYVIVPANSTLNIAQLDGSFISFIKTIPSALYITILKPFFFDNRKMLDLLASSENLMIVLALLFCIYGFVTSTSEKLWPLYFLSLAVAVLVITGLTSPNIGAIERYRAPVMPFIMMAALWFVKASEKGTDNNF